MDISGHGTFVAGIIAATAPSSYIYAVRVFEPATSCPNTQPPQPCASDSAIAAGIQAGNNIPAGIELSAVGYALNRKSVLVAAAGNGGVSTPHYPAAFPGVLSVAAVDDFGQIAPFSNYGNWVDVAAPGVQITSICESCLDPITYTVGDGTSYAAPFVAGTAALLASEYPYWSGTQIVGAIEQTSSPLPAQALGQSLQFGILAPVEELSINVYGSGSVTVAPSFGAGGTCSSSCTYPYLGGPTVVLTATPSSNSYSFSGWGGGCSGLSLSISESLNSDRNCSATFTAPTIAFSPSSATVLLGLTQQFTATVSGNSNTGVIWSVNGVVGGNSTVGTISGGLYTAPSAVPGSASYTTVTVTAASQADPALSQSAVVTITGLTGTEWLGSIDAGPNFSDGDSDLTFAPPYANGSIGDSDLGPIFGSISPGPNVSLSLHNPAGQPCSYTLTGTISGTTMTGTVVEITGNCGVYYESNTGTFYYYLYKWGVQ